MLHRFATYEEAALFVSMKRDEGYFAEILHDHVAGLWGPLAMGGVSAWVADEAIEADEDGDPAEAVIEEELRVSWLPMELSMALAHATLAVPTLMLLVAAYGLLRLASRQPQEVGLAVLAMLLLAGLLCGAALVLGWGLSGWTRWLREDNCSGHELAVLSHRALAVLLLLVATEIGAVLFLIGLQFF